MSIPSPQRDRPAARGRVRVRVRALEPNPGRAQQLARADGAGEAGWAGSRTVAGVPGASVPDVIRTAGRAGEVIRCADGLAADATAVAAEEGGEEEDTAGAGSPPPPYIQAFVGCVTPGLSAIPGTVA